MTFTRIAPGFMAACLLVTGCFSFGSHSRADAASPANVAEIQHAALLKGQSPAGVVIGPGGIHKIRHVVIVVQENRSFDQYFGTFTGADGLPMNSSLPTVCVPDPRTQACVAPYHNPNDINFGGPHHAQDAIKDLNSGKMDGFIRQQLQDVAAVCGAKELCSGFTGAPDVMGYHDQRDIPNYWTYAQQFVLQDHLFAPTASWSLPTHLFLVSGWSARCSSADPLSCTTDTANPEVTRTTKPGAKTSNQPYGWTDITYLLHKNNVSWAYYVPDGTQPSCAEDPTGCAAPSEQQGFVSLVAPLARFETVIQNHQLGNIQATSRFYEAARTGSLPSVSWIVPDATHSEHPPYSIKAGQSFVTGVVNAIMQSPDWWDTAIFVTWDEWGGFYDHVPPPIIDGHQYGLRVPGIVISPYARKGYVDHQVLSFGSYLRFIEDDFLNGQRLDPRTDGRPDGRPIVHDETAGIGNLEADFDFTQAPRPPLLLSPDGSGSLGG